MFDASGGRFGGVFTLESLVVNAPDGRGLVSAGSFTLSTTDVTFDSGATGRAPCSDPAAYSIDGDGTTLVLTDVSPADGACHGINAGGSTTTTNLSISGHRGDGVQFGGGGNKRLDLVTISGNGGAGIASSQRVTVVDATISDNAAGVVLTNTTGFSVLSRITIENHSGAGVMATNSDVTFAGATLRANSPSCDFDADSTIDDASSDPPNTDDDGSCSFATTPTTTTTTTSTTTNLPTITTTAATTTLATATTTAAPPAILPSTGRSTGVAFAAVAIVLLGWTLVRTARS